MASWEPLLTNREWQAWLSDFHLRHGAEFMEVLRGDIVVGPEVYGEAYGLWVTDQERKRNKASYGKEVSGLGTASLA